MARCKLCAKRRMNKNMREGYCHMCIDTTAIPPGFDSPPKINSVLAIAVILPVVIGMGYVLYRIVETIASIWF